MSTQQQGELSEMHLVNVYRRVLVEPRFQGHFLRRFASAFVSADRQDNEALQPAARLFIERYGLTAKKGT